MFEFHSVIPKFSMSAQDYRGVAKGDLLADRVRLILRQLVMTQGGRIHS
jgi:hypothetical protein